MRHVATTGITRSIRTWTWSMMRVMCMQMNVCMYVSVSEDTISTCQESESYIHMYIKLPRIARCCSIQNSNACSSQDFVLLLCVAGVAVFLLFLRAALPEIAPSPSVVAAASLVTFFFLLLVFLFVVVAVFFLVDFGGVASICASMMSSLRTPVMAVTASWMRFERIFAKRSRN